ncbi:MULTISPECIES: hypothetical protein [unclassified Bradyrhizobium]|uniref:hypothetical protein n=1 Tax=unclassified Bradyrhizobium TaxID=2631580 RepID=UPI001CD4E732|nr:MULTISPECIES: hypothetical protein [unclassified Bradyrhizobium]MCA1378878.1 hypothetical protein [Bradyrhizobium sp. IC4060]MCA1488982.1 hypothetical protein [Bradyrhizobium sp. IC4061]
MQSEIIPPSPKGSGPFGWLSHIQWGHGMIGKATVALVVLLVVLAIGLARVTSEAGILIIVGIGAVAFLAFLGFQAWFASRHPDLAATEGPTYVQTRQIELAAKNLPAPPITELVPDPQNPTQLKPAGLQ